MALSTCGVGCVDISRLVGSAGCTVGISVDTRLSETTMSTSVDARLSETSMGMLTLSLHMNMTLAILLLIEEGMISYKSTGIIVAGINKFSSFSTSVGGYCLSSVHLLVSLSMSYIVNMSVLMAMSMFVAMSMLEIMAVLLS